MNCVLRVCFGGSFDPVHNGHLAIARAARAAFAAEVALIPARDPPHKDTTQATAEQRTQMLNLAVAGERGLTVDARELSRSGPSYTVDTLVDLRRTLGEQQPIAWLVGADSLQQLHTWHRWRELFALAHIVCVQRPGADIDASRLRERAPEVLEEINQRWLPRDALAECPSGGFTLLPLVQLRVESSTELRHRINAGIAWRDWVPASVADYIVQQNLYRCAPAILPLTPPSACP